MSRIGPTELLIILAIVILLFTIVISLLGAFSGADRVPLPAAKVVSVPNCATVAVSVSLPVTRVKMGRLFCSPTKPKPVVCKAS